MAKKSLVIVESPAKQKTLSKFLGPNYILRASMGHVIDLPKRTLGVNIEEGFSPEYVVIPGRKKLLNEIKKAAKETENIYIATDPDREGEAIGWHIANYLGRAENHIYRVMFNEITKTAVLTALANPGMIDQNKVDAQQARRILDRLVGYQLSPLLWRKVRKGLSAGRVQSVAVRLICEREEAIKKFIPEEYWSIIAHLQAENIPFDAKLNQIDKKKVTIKNQDEAERILTDLAGATYVVDNVVTKPQQKQPPVPFTTSKLQQEGVRKLYFPTNKTMSVAQKLYEGLPIGEEGNIGLITYMRTDSTRIATEAQQQAREYIVQKFGQNFIPAVPRKYVAKGKIQDAHEAIRPTSVFREPDAIKPYLTPDQYKLYKLIWERFVASQMSPAQYEMTTADIAAKQYTFRASRTVMKFPGFTQVYMEGRDEKPIQEEEPDEREGVLPPLQQNQEVQLLNLEPKQHFTEPLPRYSEATLVKELEEQGIGRPSTYAAIIRTIQERHYVQKLKGRFEPTQLGVVVNALLVLHFPKIMEVSFTAQMETELDKIEEGQLNWVAVLNDFYVPFSTALAEAQKTMRNVKQELSTPTGETCEKCGAEMVIKWSKNGSFMACSAFPKCKNAKPIIAPKPTIPFSVGAEQSKPVTGEKCDKCGAEMVIRTGRYGNFLGCSQYPKCKNAKPIPIGTCPVPGCGGQISTKRSRKGRVFYACSNYPKCTFAIWDKPVFEKCPECAAPYLVDKFSKTEGKYIQCEKCEYKRIIETAESSPNSEGKTGL
ncbi:MAG: type I DNA topoisomerase [bacterium]|nr:type I DNA topoisomerase [bacterium]